jgi:hypothetical protein
LRVAAPSFSEGPSATAVLPIGPGTTVVPSAEGALAAPPSSVPIKSLLKGASAAVKSVVEGAGAAAGGKSVVEGAGAAAAANPTMVTKTRARTMSLRAIFAYTENIADFLSRTDQ